VHGGRIVAVGVGLVVLIGVGMAAGRMTADGSTNDELLIVPRQVERRDLDDVLTISGEVRREETQQINLPVDGKVSSIAVDDGDTVEIGDPLFALDGRTAVAVAGDFAFYRMLDVGSDGPDVDQLERILSGAGYPISSVDALFTEETRTALAQWQVDRGYGGATPEPTETITVSLAQNPAGYDVGKANTVAFSIVPSAPGRIAGFMSPRAAATTTTAAPAKPVIQVSADLQEVDEGGQVVFTFTAAPAPTTDLTVDLTIGGDATGGNDPADGDYQTIDNSFVMPAGQSTHTLVVPIFVDQVREAREDITVSLTDQFGNDPNYVVGPSNQSRIRIRANGEDLVPVITIKASTAVVDEGATVTFTFDSTIESNEDLDLVVAVAGSARNGVDYVEVDLDEITIPAGATTTTLQVQTRSDNVVEGDERLVVAVVPDPTGDPAAPLYVLGSPAEAQVVIESNDLPELTIRGGGEVAEGGVTSFTIVADAPVTADTSINYQVGGTAQAGVDFETLSGTVTMVAGASQVTVDIVTIDDDVVFLPSDMVVADWPARVGTVEVDEGEFVLQGSPVLTLTEPVFTITLAVSAGDRSELEIGQAVAVGLDASDQDLAGVIATLDDNATVGDQGEELYEGTVEVQGDLAAVDGSRATIDVTLAERLDVIAVPVAAVLRVAGGEEVRVINDAGTISRVPVTIGLIDGEWVEVTSGLTGNELVIVDVDAEAIAPQSSTPGG
jgi:multidrug efflux pump subunit AcrA (membrane-fusion protein)